MQRKKTFYLTFDGAVNLPNTLKILEALQKTNVLATFFVEGQRITGHEDILRKMAAAGHHIGNHSFHHPDFDTISAEECLEEISSTDQALKEVLGFRTMLVRPPCGILPDDRRELLEDAHYKICLWSISVKDWLGPDSSAVADRTISLAGADTVTAVYHDHINWTADTVLKIVPRLRAMGYSIEPIPYD